MIKKILLTLKYNNKLVMNNGSIILKLALAVVLLSISSGTIEIALAYGLKHFLSLSGFLPIEQSDSFISQFNFSLSTVMIFLLLINFTRFALQILNSQVTAYLAEIINIRIKSIILFDFLYQNENHPRSSGNVFYNFIEIFPKSISFFNSVIIFISYCLQATIIFSMMLYKTPAEAITGILCVGLTGLAVITLSRKMKPQTIQIPQESRELTSRVEKVSKNLLFFNIMRTKDGELISFGKNLANLSNLVLKQTFISSTANSLPQLFGFFFVIIFISRSLFSTEASLLVAFLYLFMRFTSLLSIIAQQATTLYSYHPQLKESYDFLNSVEKEIEEKSIILTSSLDFLGRPGKKTLNDRLIPLSKISKSEKEYVPPKPPKIYIVDLSFKYPSTDKYIFNNFNFHVEPGAFCGIKGISGKGKSTLLMLIAGILKPNNGTITIDSERSIDFFSKRENRIGYVGAEPYLVRGTLYENLLYGLRYQPDESELREAIANACADDFIWKLGLDYKINEDHSGISAGQKQRICIARAFLNNPSLLILDEATSNLDTETEKTLLSKLLLLKGKVTILFVSHRAAPLEYADQVITI